jgi:hypothetical protein
MLGLCAKLLETVTSPITFLSSVSSPKEGGKRGTSSPTKMWIRKSFIEKRETKWTIVDLSNKDPTPYVLHKDAQAVLLT